MSIPAATTSRSIRATRTSSTPGLWQQQQSYIEGGSFGGPSGGIFKSIDGGATWKQLTEGLPTVLQANISLAASNPRVLYAMVAGTTGAAGGPTGFGAGTVAFYRTTDGGDHWTLMDGAGVQGRAVDNRPLGAHRRRRSAEHRGRSHERERRLQLVDGVLANGGRGRHVVSGARRSRRRRLSENVDQSDQPEHPARRQRSGRRHLGESRRVVEQLVYATHRGDVPRVDGQHVRLHGLLADSRTPGRRAWPAAHRTARSRSTIGIR